MLFRKKGFPEEGEIVYGTVKEISHHVVIVALDEYDGLTGILYPHEISPGRIRNLRDYVKKGKKIVCLVLEADPKTLRINLSLRRVSEKLRKEKLNQIKREQVAEIIIQTIAKALGKDVKDVYREIYGAFSGDYLYLHEAFQDFVDGNITLEEYVNDKNLVPLLKQEILKRFSKTEVELRMLLRYTTFVSNGLGLIKTTLSNIEKKLLGDKIVYLGGGKYEIKIKRENYKEAEEIYSKIESLLEEKLKPYAEVFQISRIEE